MPRVRVVSPQGVRGTIEASEMKAAMDEGFRLEDAGANVPKPEMTPVKGSPAGNDDPVNKTLLKGWITAGNIPQGVAEMAPPMQAYDLMKQSISAAKGEPQPGVMDRLAGMFGIDKPAVAEAAQNRDWGQLGAETVVPAALSLLGARKGRNLAPVRVGADVAPEAAVNKLSYAVGAQGSKVNYPRTIQSVIGDIAETARANKGKAGFGEVIDQTLATKNQKFDAALAPIKNQPIANAGNAIADAIESKITTAMEKADPAMAEALRAEAKNFRNKTFVSSELDEIRKSRNAELDTFYSKDSIAQSVDIKKSQAGRLANKTVADTIRDVLYGEIERAGMMPAAEVRALKNSEKALLKIKQQYQKRTTSLENDVALQKGEPPLERLSGGTAYTNPMQPRNTGFHLGGVLDMFVPKAVREQHAVNSAIKNALGRRYSKRSQVIGSLAASVAGERGDE